MSDVFSKVLGGFENFGGGLGKTMGALKGPLSIFDMVSQIQQQQKQKAMLDRQIYYAKHPEALANLEKQFEKPLSTGLTTGVGNIVQGQLAERGLNQAPGIYGEVLAQALAPFQMQEQQNAMQMAMKQLGLPAEILAGSQGGGPGNLPTLLQSLMQPQGKTNYPSIPSTPSGGTSPSEPGIPSGWNPDMPDIWGGYQPTMPSIGIGGE